MVITNALFLQKTTGNILMAYFGKYIKTFNMFNSIKEKLILIDLFNWPKKYRYKDINEYNSS